MQKTSQENNEWKRYKEVNVPWAKYDAHRLDECKYVLDLKKLFHRLDKSVQRREFLVSDLTVLILFKLLFGISFRGITSSTKDLRIYLLLGMKRAPSYKTIQHTFQYLDSGILSNINRCLIPSEIHIGSVDASGLKTHRKGAWIQIRFQRYQKKRDFKKIHIFVYVDSKKILSCLMTEDCSHDAPQLKHMIRECKWMKCDIILGNRGYDSKQCFNEVTKQGAIPGIPVRKNATTRSKGCPSRRKAVLHQRKNIEKWKENVQFMMRCIVESIFSGAKRRFGEYLFSIIEKNRRIEMWLRTILWNVLIYPR